MKRKSVSIQRQPVQKTYQKQDCSPCEIVYTKKQIRNQIDRMRKPHKPLKDKEGNNLKQHAGLWKYIKTNGKVSKIYISKQCRIYTNKEASTQYNSDNTYYQKKSATGPITSLAHWQIPIGLIESINLETKITSLYNWQVKNYLGPMPSALLPKLQQY